MNSNTAPSVTVAPRRPVTTSHTAEMLRFALVEQQRLVLSRPRKGEVLLAAVAAEPFAHLDADNGLLDVDAGLSLARIARIAARLGVWFPLARPLGAMTLQAACNAMPFVPDALVHSIDAVTCDGDAYSTPMAPRSATGPGLIGALSVRPPLALAVRARIRVHQRATTTPTAERYAHTADAALRVLELHAEGRALAVDAWGSTVQLLVGQGSPLRMSRHRARLAFSGPAQDTRPFAHAPSPRSAAKFASGLVLSPSSYEDVERALARGARVVAAPLMGRLGTLERERISLPVHDLPSSVGSLVAALHAAASKSEAHRG